MTQQLTYTKLGTDTTLRVVVNHHYVFGWYAEVYVLGKTPEHITPFLPTEEQARNAALAWLNDRAVEIVS